MVESTRTYAKPTDTRPYRRMHESGPERTVVQTHPDGSKVREVLRQIGWLGQTGALYSLDENPSATEPGSYSPLWVVAHADSIDDEGRPLG